MKIGDRVWVANPSLRQWFGGYTIVEIAGSNVFVRNESGGEPMTEAIITKGTRVRYSFFQASKKLQSLSGAQLKFGATLVEGVGTVTHVWQDHPTNPTKYTFGIKPDNGGEEIEVPQGGIKGVVDG